MYGPETVRGGFGNTGREYVARDHELMRRLEATVERHYADAGFGLREMASRLGVSERQVQRRMKRLAGATPSAFLRDYRLRKSLKLLQADMPVHDIARAAGFASHAYFSSCFKARFGLTPTQFRRLRF